jgi:mitochondrial fission protein ELM1
MMKSKRVWVIDEGSQGHLVQSRGLIRELGKLVPLETVEIAARFTVRQGFLKSLTKRLLHRWRWRWLFEATHAIAEIPATAPDLIISSGPRSLLALEYFAKTRGCPAVFVQGTIEVPRGTVDVIMRPGGEPAREDILFIPLLFNEITPELIDRAAADFQLAHPHPEPLPLRALFIGQSSAKIRFERTDWQHLVDFINRRWQADRIPWLITTSYRTGGELEEFLRSQIAPGALHEGVWYATAPRKITREYLARAETAFVTMDSLTMVSEAASSGRPVTVICPERLKLDLTDSHHRYIHQLNQDGLIRLLRLPDELVPSAAGNVVATVDYQPTIRQLLTKIGWEA